MSYEFRPRVFGLLHICCGTAQLDEYAKLTPDSEVKCLAGMPKQVTARLLNGNRRR
ncbi:MAG: hypothetical protein QOI59_3090 [Gammaproteobacteria bacterium]|nr:hypothetical protein [Gammaproteobacteria bacterium]